ncbi:MAG: type 1 capsular polysaccharide biosynthesis protein [Alphaproteobacteria bacterium]|nr:type 1 capsular polysaccharide biosynthesis protein [Alphaproteobacteria bacterium]
MTHNPLLRHLDEAGESYGKHCGEAATFGFRMIGGGLACLVHAFLPFLFERTGSDAVRRLNATLCKRADRPNWERHPII